MAGIEAFARSGVRTLSITDRLYKFFEVAYIGPSFTGTQVSGQIVDPRFTQFPGAEPFAQVINGTIDIDMGTVKLTIVGNTLTWQFNHSGARRNTTFLYGLW